MLLNYYLNNSLNSGIIYPIKSHRVGGIFMHQYPLRVEKYLFEKIEIEAKSRGLKLSDMIRELLEIGLLVLNEKKIKNGKIKFKQTNSE